MPTSHRAVDPRIFPAWTGSTSAERVAVDRRRDSAKARDEVVPFYSQVKRSRSSPHHARARNPKPLVLAAFFGYFLSLVTESTPAGGIYRHKECAGRNPPATALPWPWGRELRIATAGVRTGFAMTGVFARSAGALLMVRWVGNRKGRPSGKYG